MESLDRLRVRAPRFLLLYPPLQFASGEVAKPDGSLSLAYLAGALLRAGYECRILDCAVGFDDQPLSQTFFRTVSLPSGLQRVGMSTDDVLEIADGYDVIGVSSIYTPQTTPCLDLIRALGDAMPHKLVLAGGVNARHLRRLFFAAGVDIIAVSEAEDTIVHIARALEGDGRISDTPGIAFRDETGQEVVNPAGPPISNLDELPFPAWNQLPLRRYWEISRPHGGSFAPGTTVRYASLQTSRGCPFRCVYCHISKENDDSESGRIGGLRLKSVDRVVEELHTLKDLGVEKIFLEDDSLLAKKRRAMRLFEIIKKLGFDLLDVNGINLAHLLRKNGGKLVVDRELIDAMAEAGFSYVTLPFESASQRIIDKYASGKWRIERLDTRRLLDAFADAGIRVSGNYMIGYPDETLDEIFDTIRMARRHVDEGIHCALFFAVVPFPGSTLFDHAVCDGHLDADFDPDAMRWTKSIMRNLAIEPGALEHIRQLAWLIVNRPDYVDYKRGMTMPRESREPSTPQKGVPLAEAMRDS